MKAHKLFSAFIVFHFFCLVEHILNEIINLTPKHITREINQFQEFSLFSIFGSPIYFEIDLINHFIELRHTHYSIILTGTVTVSEFNTKYL
jgi:hypothetical protein